MAEWMIYRTVLFLSFLLSFLSIFRFMDNLQTEVLEIEFLTYSKGMTTISEEDFAKILLRFTNVENISAYLENVRQCIPDEKVQYTCAYSYLLDNSLISNEIIMKFFLPVWELLPSRHLEYL